MKFEKDAKKTGIINLIWGSVFLIGLSILLIFINQHEASLLIVSVVLLIGFLIIVIFLVQGVTLIKSGGKWLIIIDDTGISWSSPNESIDKSFNIRLSGLVRTETRIRRKTNSATRTSKRDHYLLMRNGNEQKLSPNSGINLIQVITELERLNIKNEVIYL